MLKDLRHHHLGVLLQSLGVVMAFGVFVEVGILRVKVLKQGEFAIGHGKVDGTRQKRPFALEYIRWLMRDQLRIVGQC